MSTEIPQQRRNDRRHCRNYSQFKYSVGACSNRFIHYIDQPVLKQDWQMNHIHFHMEMKVKEDKTIKCVNDQSFFFPSNSDHPAMQLKSHGQLNDENIHLFGNALLFYMSTKKDNEILSFSHFWDEEKYLYLFLFYSTFSMADFNSPRAV